MAPHRRTDSTNAGGLGLLFLFVVASSQTRPVTALESFSTVPTPDIWKLTLGFRKEKISYQNPSLQSGSRKDYRRRMTNMERNSEGTPMQSVPPGPCGREVCKVTSSAGSGLRANCWVGIHRGVASGKSS